MPHGARRARTVRQRAPFAKVDFALGVTSTPPTPDAISGLADGMDRNSMQRRSTRCSRGTWMIYISEEESAALVTPELAFEVARKALVAAASEQSGVFPAVLGRTREATDTFSIKSGWSGDLAAVKIGSFWAGNPARGLPRHNSTILPPNAQPAPSAGRDILHRCRSTEVRRRPVSNRRSRLALGEKRSRAVHIPSSACGRLLLIQAPGP